MSRAIERAQRSDPLRELEDALVDRSRARHALLEALQRLHGPRATSRSVKELEEEVDRRAAAVRETEGRVNGIVSRHTSCGDDD